jgi:hypothetical protein
MTLKLFVTVQGISTNSVDIFLAKFPAMPILIHA